MSTVLRTAACFLLIFCAESAAQEVRASITGRVTDASGAAIPGAKVILVNTETNIATPSSTGETGLYNVLYLTPGTYRATVEAQGFKRLVREGIEVRVGDRITLDLQLEVGAMQESITVTAEATPLLELASASTAQLIDRRRISELPLADGNPLALVRLAPGSVVRGGWTSASAMSNSGPSNFTVSGAPGSNEYTLDGSPNTADKSTGNLRVGLQPPTEAVEEFRVVSASFDAQQGHTAGASVDMAVRSGTNHLRGSLYEFVRNDVLSANSFFLNRSPFALDENGKSKRQPRRYNRFGGTVGGPALVPKLYNGKDRTFFFVAYENIRTVTPAYETLTLPSEPFRNGDFSSLVPAGQYVYDPATARRVGDRVVRDPIQCGGRLNVICPDRISNIAKTYLSWLPLPNLPGSDNNYYGNAPGTNNYKVLLARADHTFGVRHKVFFRYAWSDRDEYDENSAGRVNGVRINGRNVVRGNRGGVFDYVLSGSPTTVVNLRAGYQRFRQTRTALSEIDTDVTKLGFPASTLALFGSKQIPQFNIGGFSSPVEPSGYFIHTRIPSHQSVITKIVGAHAMRFGYDVRVYQENRKAGTFRSGSYSFANNFTRINDQNISVPADQNRAQSMASFLLGVPTGGSIPIPADPAATSVYHGLFFQNDWKVHRRLTLNLGLRWEYETPPTERYNRNIRGFDFTTPSPVEAEARANYARSPIPELPVADFRVRGGLLFTSPSNRGFFNGDWNNFQPRLGAAFLLNSRTVLRGGIAIYTVPYAVDGINQYGFSSSTPVTPSPDLGLTFTATVANPFPQGLILPRGSADGLLTFIGQGVSFVPVDRKAGQSLRLEFNIQRELPGRYLVTAGYTGTRGYDLTTGYDENQLARRWFSTSPIRNQAVIDFNTAPVTNPFRGITAFSGTGHFSNSTLQRQQLLRPYPQFTGVSGQRFDGSSSYHSGQLRVERRFSKGYTVMGQYTYSKYLEKVSRLNAFDEKYENRLNNGDSPHRVSLSGIWELPFGKGRPWGSSWSGWKEAALGGFQLQVIYLYQSGAPLTLGNIYYNGNLSELKATIKGSTIGALGTTNTLDNVFGIDLTKSGFYFQDDAVKTNGVLDPVKQRNDPRINLSYNVRTLPSRVSNLRNQGISLFDASLLKNFPIGERFKLQFRVEAINAFNRAHFAGPNLDPRSANLGRVTNTDLQTLPAEYQLGLRLMF